MAKILISTVAPSGQFFRLGRAWTKDGVVVEQSDFSDAEWEILASDQMLHIRPAPAEAELAAASDEALVEAVKVAISEMAPGDFQQDGKPKLSVLKELMPEEKSRITAQLRDQVWAALAPAAN